MIIKTHCLLININNRHKKYWKKMKKRMNSSHQIQQVISLTSIPELTCRNSSKTSLSLRPKMYKVRITRRKTRKVCHTRIVINSKFMKRAAQMEVILNSYLIIQVWLDIKNHSLEMFSEMKEWAWHACWTTPNINHLLQENEKSQNFN